MASPRTIGTLYGVGIGPGNPDLLTLRAADVLRQADVVFHVAGPRTRQSISKRMVEALAGCAGKSEELAFSMSQDREVRRQSVQVAAERVVCDLKSGQNCAFATLGDPLIYSTFSYLLREIRRILPHVQVEIIPGITAFQAAAAAFGEPLVEDEEVLTIVPRWNPDKRHLQALQAADTAVCLKTYRDRSEVLQAVRKEMRPETLLYAARVGHQEEVLETEWDAIAAQPIDYLSLIIARRHSADG